MSDSPIFDMMDRERRYTKTMAETKRLLARHTSPLFVRVVPVPDEEEEVFVRPFVKTEPAQEVPRTFKQVVSELADVPGIQLTATVLEVVTGSQYETVREETEFDPMELMNKDILFTTFATERIAKYREEHPDVERINFFVDPGTSFNSPTEKFVIEGRRPKEQIQNPDEVVARPLPGIQLDDHLPEFGVQLIGAQDVPSEVLEAYRVAVAEQYPGCVPMAITAIQEDEDGSATLAFEGKDFSPLGWIREEDLGDDADTTDFEKRSLEYFGKKPWTSTQPLSEKNTAQTTE
jgi:hypothetical protein